MIKKARRTGVLGLVLFAAIVCAGPASAADDDWQFDFALYGWLPVIDVELPSGNKSKITRDDIVNNLDMAFMGRARALKNKWSLTTDIIYFDLQHKGREALLPGLDLRKIELQAALIKPTVGYQVFESDKNLIELYAGGRYFWVQPTLTSEIVTLDPPDSFQDAKSDSRWDALVGVRGRYDFSERWYVPYYADIGTGESDSVVDLLAGVGYRFQRVDLVAAWRYLDYDFGNDFPLKTMTVNGPLIGVEYSFGSKGTH
jgi:hypothetical protein